MNPYLNGAAQGRLVYGLPAATHHAVQADWLFLCLLLVSLAVVALVFGMMLIFLFRYHANSGVERGKIAAKTYRFEIAWTTATLLAFFGIFVWGALQYTHAWASAPSALKIYVFGKQWMWKVEHLGGQREINQLHVPVDRPITLIMSSEDVIHSVGIPAFRFKKDVVPGRYESVSFYPIQIGEYHWFCDQYCGTDHSRMVGIVYVMSRPDYQKWLSQNGTAHGLVAEGRGLFTRFGCGGCHNVGPGTGGGYVRAPSLVGLYGSPVPLNNGQVVIADDRYIRDSILNPGQQIVASYENRMPNFSGQLSEEDVIKLIAYIKSLAPAR